MLSLLLGPFYCVSTQVAPIRTCYEQSTSAWCGLFTAWYAWIWAHFIHWSTRYFCIHLTSGRRSVSTGIYRGSSIERKQFLHDEDCVNKRCHFPAVASFLSVFHLTPFVVLLQGQRTSGNTRRDTLQLHDAEQTVVDRRPTWRRGYDVKYWMLRFYHYNKCWPSQCSEGVVTRYHCITRAPRDTW